MGSSMEGRVALVTGAARGQGRSHAVTLAQRGADLILLDVAEDIATAPYPGATEADLAETAALVAGLGRRVHLGKADVRSLAQVQAVVDEGVDRLGRLDVVCANAGILSFGRAHELTEEAWLELIDINLNGVWRTTRATTPHLVAGGRGGSIVISSSGAALHGVANIAHYVAAKTGIVGLMRSLAIELAPHRIRVNCVSPTNVDTPMIQHEDLYRLYLPDAESPTRDDFARAAAPTHPMGVPWVEVSDVSNAVAFLASDDARFITGIQLPIQAGRDCP